MYFNWLNKLNLQILIFDFLCTIVFLVISKTIIVLNLRLLIQDKFMYIKVDKFRLMTKNN